MIRIKCPKCSEPITADDDEAGQPGECESCGAKFRIPLPKAKAGAGKGSAARHDEDDEDDEIDEEEDEAADDRPKKAKKSKRLSESAKTNLAMVVSIFCCMVAFGIGSIFIGHLAEIVGGVCAVSMIYCMLMVSVKAKQESAFWMVAIWVIPGCLVIFGLSHWDRLQRFVIAYVGMLLTLGLCTGGYFIHKYRVEAQRITIRRSLGESVEAPKRIIRWDLPVAGPAKLRGGAV
jgi:DNA-directed RNA polymerase subunit M/transcription elongation factor TFIIS